jgi:hypothetical protein
MNDADTYADELQQQEEDEQKCSSVDKSKSTVNETKKKEVEAHHAWKEQAYKNQPTAV